MPVTHYAFPTNSSVCSSVICISYRRSLQQQPSAQETKQSKAARSPDLNLLHHLATSVAHSEMIV